MRFSLRPGNVAESKELVPLLRISPELTGRLLADKAYDSRTIRQHLAASGIEAVIPATRNPGRTQMPPCDLNAYNARHLVENAFADLKQFRGIATRYCKLAATFTAMLSLCCWVINTRPTRRAASRYV